jgi:hypothetical protein
VLLLKIISRKALEKLAGVGDEFTFEKALAKTVYMLNFEEDSHTLVDERFLMHRND